MTAPADHEIFRLLWQLQILSEAESNKARLRYYEAGGSQPLLQFLLDGGYLSESHLARLQAMDRSSGGDLSDAERVTLAWIRQRVAQQSESPLRPSQKSTLHGVVREKTKRPKSLDDTEIDGKAPEQ